MDESIRIQNFRGLKDLTIENLGRVNLLVGANNVGKTSVLEALALLHLHQDGYELGLILESRGFREGESYDGALTGFLLGNESFFEIGGKRKNGFDTWLRGERFLNSTVQDGHRIAHLLVQLNNRESLQLYYFLDPHSGMVTASGLAQMPLRVPMGSDRAYPRPYHRSELGEVALMTSSVRLTTPNLANLLTERERVGQAGSIADQLHSFDPRVVDMFVGFDLTDREVSLDVKLDGGSRIDVVPLRSMGEGSRRLIDLLLLLPLAKDGIGLIDEVDAGVYHQNLSDLWRLLNQTSRDNGLQIFATTHSLECIEAALRAFEGPTESDLRVIRLERSGDGVEAVDIEYDQVATLFDLSFEFR